MSTPPPKAQLYVAIALLALFAVTVGYMLVVADQGGQAWERRVYIFSGVEAIVFTAVGWIFGREVHRATAEQATEEAKSAKQEAKEAQADAQKGLALKAAIEAAPAGTPPAGSGPSDASPQQRAAPNPHLQSLKDLAQKLYE